MNLAQAAKTWLAEHARRREAKAEFEEAEKKLKEYFRRTGKAAYGGVSYTCTTSTRLDTKGARELLGDKAPMVDGTRETLTPVARP